MKRSRRALLTALGTAVSASVAGCPGRGNGSQTTEPTPQPTQSAEPSATKTEATARETESTTPGPVVLNPGDSYTTDAGWSLTVENVTVRIAVVEHGTTHLDPRWAADGQFVVADVAVDGEDAPDPANLHVTCRTDDEDRSGRVFVAADSNRAGRRQRMGFEVPSSPAPTDGAVVWTPDDGPEVRWTLSDARLRAVAQPPEFELQSFSVADAPGDEVEVTLTVANSGDGDGVFLAEVGAAAMSDQPEIAVAVSAGETRTATRRVRTESPSDGPTTVVLRWRDTTIERTVESSETSTDADG